MTKKEKRTAAQVVVLLEELIAVSNKEIIKDEAKRLIEELRKSYED